MAETVDSDDDLTGDVYRVLVRELGEDMAAHFVRMRRAQDAWERERRPDEGLRERKKRATRQRISDIATALFTVRGFDQVRVADIARLVGVSEKTIYNYFPTKESMVFDLADEGTERLVSALRDRAPRQSPTMAVVAALEHDLDRFLAVTFEGEGFLPAFADMAFSHPALRAAWMELRERLVRVTQDELAASLDVDPGDPEPMIAARAVVGLEDVWFAALRRHVEAGHRGDELRDRVLADLRRAARELDTGLWALDLLAQGGRTSAQLRESAKAAERASAQVVATVRQARAAWRETTRVAREASRAATREQRRKRS